MQRITSGHNRQRLLGALAITGIWAAFVAGTVLHIYVRSHADDLGRTVHSVDGAERAVFHGMPSLWLQHWLGLDIAAIEWLDMVLYASWFHGPILLALLVQLRCGRGSLAGLLAMHLALFFSADVLFALFPTRPPWMDIDVTRVVSEAYGSATRADPNPVAAVPSLHVAVPALYAVWYWRQHDPFLRRLAPFVALWTVGVAWSVVYGGEHYVLDVVAGVAWAAGVYVATSFAWAARHRSSRPLRETSRAPVPG